MIILRTALLQGLAEPLEQRGAVGQPGELVVQGTVVGVAFDLVPDGRRAQHGCDRPHELDLAIGERAGAAGAGGGAGRAGGVCHGHDRPFQTVRKGAGRAGRAGRGRRRAAVDREDRGRVVGPADRDRQTGASTGGRPLAVVPPLRWALPVARALLVLKILLVPET